MFIEQQNKQSHQHQHEQLQKLRQYQQQRQRQLDMYSFEYYLWGNNTNTNVTDFDTSNLVRPEDVSVDAVLTSLYFNTVVFFVLMISYECLRRLLPTVYSFRKKLDRTHLVQTATTNTTQKSALSLADSTTSSLSASSSFCSNDKSVNQQEAAAAAATAAADGTLFGLAATHEGGPPPPIRKNSSDDDSLNTLPDDKPLDWIGPVFGVPWNKVRQTAGLDGYFFLRYIRMNVRITAVSTFWFFLILVPIYATGSNPYNNNNNLQAAQGWYHISASNLPAHGWRMWVPCVFAYLFTAFILFVIKQEYRHFLEIRQEFLAKGCAHVNPQHHYSLMIENIPCELRSDTALKDYFEKLFPGKVHSASVVMNIPDLEEASNRCLRTCRRLEKSIAHLNATGNRPTHIVGQGRLTLLGIDLNPLADVGQVRCMADQQAGVVFVEDGRYAERPPRGTMVDSISYYTQELAANSRTLFKMQQRKAQIAESGNLSLRADNWYDQVARNFTDVANQILDESVFENELQTPNPVVMGHNSFSNHHTTTTTVAPNSRTGIPIPPSETLRQRMYHVPQAETMASHYGSFGFSSSFDDDLRRRMRLVEHDHHESSQQNQDHEYHQQQQHAAISSSANPESNLSTIDGAENGYYCIANSLNGVQNCVKDGMNNVDNHVAPFSKSLYKNACRRCLGKLGLDFLAAGIKSLNRQLDVALEGVVGATMSSTGFVTFLDLTSTTCAASAPLSVKANVLTAKVAPEPREIRWENAHVSQPVQVARERIVNTFLFFGIILWSFPLAAIQAFAKAKYLAQIPGMEWILSFHGGTLTSFVNGYMPVVALLMLIMVLPLIFEFVAVHYEHRKTFSDVQASMMGRYFYFQVANVYVSVTAGSIYKSLAQIIDHPSSILTLLGESLPSMVGYFVAILVTKILAGLPMIFLRFGALSRLLFLKTLAREHMLTQRELDAVYGLENIQYGWEYPAMLLVVVIVFTYAVICPVILPVGLVYFMGALVVYKKQILYVYSPVYESGGAMFPQAVQRTMFGLVCGQMLLLGYISTRGCYYQPVFLLPLPVITMYAMAHFNKTYAEPSSRLSLERAREYDIVSAIQEENNGVPVLKHKRPRSDAGIEARRRKFDRCAYRQPVLTEVAAEPWTYRRGVVDTETLAARERLRAVNRYMTRMNTGDYRGENGIVSPL